MDKKRKFVDNMQEFVLIEEADATIKYANPAFCEFVGKTENEIVGMKLWDFMVPEDRIDCDMQYAVTPDQPDYRVEGRTRNANGEIRWIQYVGRGFFDNDGNLFEFQEVGLDITLWKEQIETSVRKLEKVNAHITGAAGPPERYTQPQQGNKLLGNIAVYTFDDIITRNSKMQTLIKQAKAVAQTDSSVVIEGESGTGKELFAQSIHNASKRANGPFVAINCGAISPELLQSELFGYIEGAFTGAAKGGRPGKFELANMGTLFLDEIGEMPLDQQVSLLRVLETKTVTRIGDNRVRPIDVRIICATNKDLYMEVKKGNFRDDLYFRLNVINIFVPPLRERKDDIIPLIASMKEEAGGLYPERFRFTEEERKVLYAYSWPGNIRELKNITERLVVMPGYDLKQLLINEKAVTQDTTTYPSCNDTSGEMSEKSIIENKIKDCRGNITLAAKELGISRKTLYKRIEKYQIEIHR